MSRKRKNREIDIEYGSSSSDDDYGKQRKRAPKKSQKTASKSQANKEKESAQSKTALDSLSKEQVQKLVTDSVRYILFRHQSNQLIKKAQFTKDVVDKHKKTGLTPALLNEANAVIRVDMPDKFLSCVTNRNYGVQVFKSTFGMELVELPKSKRDKTGARVQDGSGSFILRSTLSRKLRNQLMNHLTDNMVSSKGLHMIVASLIFLNNAPIHDNVLYEHLKKLGFEKKVDVPPFGKDWHKIIEQELVSQNYLTRTKTNQTAANGEPVCEIDLGARSRRELPECDILSFISELLPSLLKSFKFATLIHSQVMDEKEPDTVMMESIKHTGDYDHFNYTNEERERDDAEEEDAADHDEGSKEREVERVRSSRVAAVSSSSSAPQQTNSGNNKQRRSSRKRKK